MLKGSLLRFLVRLKRRYDLAGPLLTLGVQDILLQYHEAEELIRSEGLAPSVVPQDQRQVSRALWLRDQPRHAALIHARTFFRLLGISDYTDLDASPAEEPCLVHDLNQPVPVDWHGRYRWILDGGTSEHVFDVRSVLTNLVRLCQVGGHVMHISPTTGWSNHGFYQLSPCLFFDFYGLNGFRPLAACLALQIEASGGGLRFVPYHYSAERIALGAGYRQALLIFVAKKVADVDEIKIPIQTKYRDRMPGAIAQRVG
jgi:hypothetical protein